MEPISILFSSFLTGMTGGLQNQKIDYQYQLWKIKTPSVCARVKSSNLSNYSSCTTSAKELFAETCTYLQSRPQQHWKYKKLKNMYCIAASNYEPTIAQLSRPTEDEAQLWEAKQKCSLLTLEARNTNSIKIAQKRDAACTTLK
jgi:hypothetical protein